MEDSPGRINASPSPTLSRVEPLQLPQQSATIPKTWIDEAANWLTGSSLVPDLVWVQIVTVQFQLPSSEVGRFLEEAWAARRLSAIQVVSDDLADQVRGVSGQFGGYWPTMALAAGGPGATDKHLIDSMDALVTVARRLGPTMGYGFISFDRTFASFAASFPAGRRTERDAAGGDAVQLVSDEFVVDAFPYQILGEGHRRRLMRKRPVGALRGTGLPKGAQWLDGNRFELRTGDPTEWLLSNPRRDRTQQRARRLLNRCLATSEEVRELVAEKKQLG